MKASVAAVLVVVAVAMVSLAAKPGEAISCGDIQGSLSPCIGYLTDGGEPSESCCAGVKSLAGSIQSQQDRQTACYCIKSAASSFSVRSDTAYSLAGKCGVSVDMNMSPDVDCSQIS